MRAERLGQQRRELINGAAGGVEDAEQDECLGPHRGLHDWVLPQLRHPQGSHDLPGAGGDPTLPPATTQRRLDPALRHP